MVPTDLLSLWLDRFAEVLPGTKLLVVIDGINHLQCTGVVEQASKSRVSGRAVAATLSGPAGQDADLKWLPRSLPPNVSMLLSCTSGDMVAALAASRGKWQVVDLPAMTASDSEKVRRPCRYRDSPRRRCDLTRLHRLGGGICGFSARRPSWTTTCSCSRQRRSASTRCTSRWCLATCSRRGRARR